MYVSYVLIVNNMIVSFHELRSLVQLVVLPSTFLQLQTLLLVIFSLCMLLHLSCTGSMSTRPETSQYSRMACLNKKVMITAFQKS